jgi:methylmalonyl-CoA mutase
MVQDLIGRCGSPEAGTENSTPVINDDGHNKNYFILGEWRDIKLVATSISKAENEEEVKILQGIDYTGASKIDTKDIAPVLGITGTGGSGKSSLTDEIVRRFLTTYPEKTIAVISVDPSTKKTGGALLGDRIRMNAIHHPRAYMRSLATRENDTALSKHVQEALKICGDAGYDFIIL